ncbi:hypothetical protein PPERSA_11404 [Pseudocohnilembus persalinus]|uniref:B box-type domain-containing protein n=1 Tax=Pseudocohnilembus persalinus TaxID=266149 RepID=A0A0V0QQI4_PSEPJ|nr:hypothetical protein PPERSA_11404 [Pseudocohnilembus persalinus]|eukprot:KRX04280.1 hypothetical protein PPERSA_11404 [Pseudocohnilembus persalinus]
MKKIHLIKQVKLYTNNCVVCPECSFCNQSCDINIFPKNIALLKANNIREQNQQDQKEQQQQLNLQQQRLQDFSRQYASNIVQLNHDNKQNKNYSNSDTKASNYDQIKQNNLQEQIYFKDKKNENQCNKHQKKFEAFCQTDEQLLCINCIIQDGHQMHSIDSIEEAFAKEKENLSYLFIQIKEQRNDLQQLINKIDSNVFNLKMKSNDQIYEITSFFEELKNIINEREQTLKNEGNL